MTLPEAPFVAELTVEAYLQGVRIDSFLVRHFRNYTPYRMQRLVRAGQVRIEGVVAETSSRVYKGQTVQVRLVEPPDHLLPEWMARETDEARGYLGKVIHIKP